MGKSAFLKSLENEVNHGHEGVVQELNRMIYRLEDEISREFLPAMVFYVKYEIMKDGKLGDYEIISSSADKQVEKAAIKALKKSSPFEPLPEGFVGDKVDVQFTFDYNVHKK